MEYNRTLLQMGFVAGKASTCVFYHPDLDVRLVVHGDDFVLSGQEKHLHYFADQLKQKYLVKIRGVLGPDQNDQKAITLLNRVVEWTEDGLQIEADPRHVELVLRDLGLQYAKGSSVAGTVIEEDDLTMPLTEVETTRYRSVVARCNYLAADRPDIQFAVKELCREMSTPTTTSMSKLKKLGRYLQRHPRLLIYFSYQHTPCNLGIYADADYAGCRRTRRSTNGGCTMLGEHCIKHGPVRSLSSPYPLGKRSITD